MHGRVRGLAVLAALLPLLAVGPARADDRRDEFDDSLAPAHFELRSGALRLVLKGAVKLELHDLQGEGGPGYDSPTDTKTLGTRSPFVEIDSFRLAFRLGLGETLELDTEVAFTPSSAAVDAVWLDWRGTGPSWLSHHVEAGYAPPVVKVHRRSERYPLIGTIAWRDPEIHAAYEAVFRLAERVSIEAAASLAMMRPLDLATVQDSRGQPGTLSVLAYGRARTFSGNGPVGGGRLRVSAWGAFAEAFAFAGRLSTEGGTDVLRAGLMNYRRLPGYDAAGSSYGRFRWFGARAGYEDHGVHAWAEGILFQEDLLTRWGAYAQASYAIPILRDTPWLRHLEPLVRGELYRIRDAATPLDADGALRSTAVVNASSWDWDVLTIGLIADVYADVLKVRAEYTFLREHNGVPALGVADEPVRNDELVLQAEVRF
jgi:hypothetical protein